MLRHKNGFKKLLLESSIQLNHPFMACLCKQKIREKANLQRGEKMGDLMYIPQICGDCDLEMIARFG